MFSRKVIAYIECKKPDEFDTDKKVEAAINQEIDVAKELGEDFTVADFVMYEKGEGLEKREDDFAAEIEKMVMKHMGFEN